VGKKMKKTLVFELFASILVVALLAGLNALMGKSLALDNELTLLSLDSRDVAVNAHRRHHGARHGHAQRHHERRRPVEHNSQPAQPQPAGGNTPATHNATPPAPPVQATPAPATTPQVQ